jgi:hypothetical protein
VDVIDIGHFALIEFGIPHAVVRNYCGELLEVSLKARAKFPVVLRVNNVIKLVPPPVTHEAIVLHLKQLGATFIEHPQARRELRPSEEGDLKPCANLAYSFPFDLMTERRLMLIAREAISERTPKGAELRYAKLWQRLKLRAECNLDNRWLLESRLTRSVGVHPSFRVGTGFRAMSDWRDSGGLANRHGINASQ